MNPRMFHRLMLAGMLAAAIPQAMAQDLPAGLAACREEQDEIRRLACYDSEIDRLRAKPAAGTVSQTAAPPTAPVAAAAPASPEAQFGYRGELAREENEKKEKQARALDEMVATVTGISARADGTLVITLENGQVWAQNRPDPYFRLKVGDTARIKPAMLGSFLLSGPAKRSTRVARVR